MFKDVLTDFLEIVKDAHVIAYDAAFDMSFINNELLRASYPSTIFDIASRVSCAMELATQKFGLKRKVKLDAACKRYQIDISNRQIHSALLDAQLCAELYFKLIDDSQVPLSRTPQSNKHRETKPIILPKAFKPKKTNETVQVNFCKNSECANFGVPAKNPVYKNYKTRELKRGLVNDYKLTLAKDGTNQLTCKFCGQSTTLVHNRCFTLEADRVKAI
ncbi:exonuclease domain-containing protein [Pseudoalteromonas tunicata]|uniref:exonuclease domain-containing protein n=1 Tax=Pseudoalteromonas tunicata TaxID=314281 RepID=UPI00273DDCF0|nr:exonuclease domain-containing protein [Pseudoalteromonas tunicata]MDP5212383.1 exonuclease domain-containing protein [Pseudoalteromonas tunicata]